MTLFERIKELCNERQISMLSLEKNCNLSNGSIIKWKNSIPSAESLQRIADYFGVRVDWLQGTSEYKTDDELFLSYSENNLAITDVIPLIQYGADWEDKIKKGSLIPIRGFSRAGIPNLAIEDINYDDPSEWEEIDPKLAKTGTFLALRIKGDSMQPEFNENDIVIVRSQSDANNGDIVIAKVNGDEACCKKLFKRNDGIILHSLNPEYAPMFFSQSEIQDKPVTIIGKVIELRRKF